MHTIAPRKLLAASSATHTALLATISPRAALLSSSTVSHPAVLPFPTTTTATSLGSPRYSSSLPLIAQSSFWKSLIPKPFRREEKLPDDPKIQRVKPKRSKEWNPATFYIVIFLLIGSMAVNMISLRQNFERFMRQTDVRVGVLREVVERIQRGEKVDVEQALGTGNPDKEQGWEEVLKEIEREDLTRNQRREKARGADPAPLKSKPESETARGKPEAPETDTVKTKQAGSGLSGFF